MRKGKRGSPGSASLPESPRHRAHLWPALAVAVLLVGASSSFLVANAVARNDAANNHRAFVASSAEISSTLQLTIQHEEDLIVSAGGFVAGDPFASNLTFGQWATSVRALQRYPELIGFGHSVVVAASQLRAFVALVAPDSVGDGALRIVPAGHRPFYCLAVGSVARTAKTTLPAGYDFCAGEGRAVSLAARDSGHTAYFPVGHGSGTYLSILAPTYQAGVPIATVAERRNEFLGWVGMYVRPEVILKEALVNDPSVVVSMHFVGDTSDATVRSGVTPKGAQSITTDLHNGWMITTSAVVHASGVWNDMTALGLLFAGLAMSALLALLILVLATGRVRALRLVADKTGELRHQALHDALTGLPNRALIMDRIEQLLARNRRQGTVGAAFFIDLDEFKNVNDTLGHAAGDRLLEAVSHRLTAGLRDADTIGRMGGDEFVVLIDGALLQSAPELVAERVLEIMRQPFELDGAATPTVVTATIGVAVGYREVPEQLLRDADMALYQAKAAGKNCYEVFHPEMETTILRRYELEFDLRSALEDGQFRVVYQPVYNLGDLTLTGVEALIRWDHPTLGGVEPGRFIPLLESSGHIVEVGRWVLREACTRMARWRAQGHDLTVAVNVSGRQLDRDVIVADVRDALQTSGLAPAALIIEVTETALMRNVDTTARRLRELKVLGVQVAIDDFGTGYSSLAYLQRFPVDCIKIDRSFIDTISDSRESDALVHTLVQLGKDLGLKTLAEGVETTQQLDHLRREDVNEAQGFLLARPLSPEVFEAQLLELTRPSHIVAPPLSRS
jgi:diguanylate cyclase (GGDEF)-like protein